MPRPRLDCHERALGLLAVRPRSRSELRSRLLRAGFDTAQVEGELERLEAVGLVDDVDFARRVVEHEVSARLSGRRAIVNRLAAKGVDRATIERTLEEVGVPDEERALELARGRARRLGGLRPERAYPRLVAFLTRRGYEPALASSAARAALDVQPD